MKKIFLAALILSSVEILSLSFVTNEIFAGTAQPILSFLNTASHRDAGAARIDFPATTVTRFVLAIYGEVTPRSEGFFTAKENPSVMPPSVAVMRYFFTMNFAPKVSRYIANSVLNI